MCKMWKISNVNESKKVQKKKIKEHLTAKF